MRTQKRNKHLGPLIGVENDVIRKRIEIGGRYANAKLEITEDVIEIGNLSKVLKAFRSYDDFSPFDKEHGSGRFEVEGEIYTFSFFYFATDGSRFVDPESQAFDRRIVLSHFPGF